MFYLVIRNEVMFMYVRVCICAPQAYSCVSFLGYGRYNGVNVISYTFAIFQKLCILKSSEPVESK
jgi:hypothetical protein